MRPLFQASEILVKQYENRATTEREEWEDDQAVDAHVSRVKANLIFGWIDQSIANLLERNPSFSVTPLSEQSSRGADPVGSLTNYYYRETNQLRQDERCLLDAFLTPYGVKKLGWTEDLEEDVQAELDGEELRGFDFADDVDTENEFLLSGEPAFVSRVQDHALHIEAHSRLTQDPLLDLDPVALQMIEEHIELHHRMLDQPEPDKHKDVKFSSPFGVRWNPEDFLVDPLAEDGIRDAQWVAFRSRRRVDDVKSNPNYTNTDDLEASGRPQDAPELDTGLLVDDFGLVTLWEIWVRDFPMANGRRENMLIVLAEGHDHLLRHDEGWPYDSIEDFPVEVLSFHSSVGHWVFKPGLVMAGADNIQGLANEILDSYLPVLRKQKNHLMFDPQVVSGDWIDNLLAAPDMAASPVQGLSSMKGSPIQAVQFGNIPNDKGQMLNQILGLFDRAAGTPQPMSSPGEKTATEESIRERRTTAREARRGNLLAEFQIRVARKFWQMVTQFRPPRAVLVNPAMAEWVTVTPEIAKGEYRFRIELTSQANQVALERKQWLDLLNLSAGLSGVFGEMYNGQTPNLAEIFKRLLVKGYEEQAPEEILPMLKNQQQQQPNPPAPDAGPAGPPMDPAAPQPGSQADSRREPSIDGAPTEIRNSGNGAGPALPRQFNAATPSAAGINAGSEER
tara:strand:- start:10479 stop:12509 length:2031 start_codon:yes stop_codon:yes gene_type:complete